MKSIDEETAGDFFNKLGETLKAGYGAVRREKKNKIM